MEKARAVKLRYTRPALADLAQLLDFLAESSPSGARRVGPRIRTLTGKLTAHPFLGARTDEPSIRRLVVRPFPYLVFYEVASSEIVVHAVRHAARDPETMPSARQSDYRLHRRPT